MKWNEINQPYNYAKNGVSDVVIIILFNSSCNTWSLVATSSQKWQYKEKDVDNIHVQH